ncbi:hypothetical protein GCM10027418_13750 [Mariniluteicoccus endophyticus]
MRILTLSDSDSYLKWVVSLLEDVPEHWRVRHVVVANVIAPSLEQVRHVQTSWPLERRSVASAARAALDGEPDVILVACTGPGIEAVMDWLDVVRVLRPRGGRARPVLLTGLPGVSYPANDLAIRHRRDFDLMVLGSHREVSAYAEVVARLGVGPRPVLQRLPFLVSASRTARGEVSDVVFAAQALVPPRPDDRCRILGALAGVPASLQPVVKVRALAGERQTHNEEHPYPDLWAAMDHPREVVFRAGSMQDALARAAGFVTVSSTAVLEAVAAGVPSLVLGDFGVSAEMINLVFDGSGLIGDLDDLAAGRFFAPDPGWLRDNYFHDAADDELVGSLEGLVSRRDDLAPVRFRPLGSPRERVRRHLRMVSPAVPRR